jgi:hypothetical protein
MAAEQKLVCRWSETRLFFRIAHCLRAYKMENMKLLVKVGMSTGSFIVLVQ